MLHYTQRRFKDKRAVRRTQSLKHDGPASGPAETSSEPCQGESLVSNVDGTVTKCGCGHYHVQINAVTLHLTALQFDAAARLFKLAWGMVVGRRISVSMAKLNHQAIVVLVALLGWAGVAAAAPSSTGFLVVAPDRGFLGNQETHAVFDAFKESYPAALAFGGREYGNRPGNYSSYLTGAVEQLRAGGATEIVVVPMFLSSSDPLLKKVQTHLPDAAPSASVQWASTMQGNHLVSQILLDRVAALSRDAEHERVILLGAGAADAAGEATMRKELQRLADYVGRYRRFKEIQVGVYYDRDAEPTLREGHNETVDRMVIDAAAKKGTTLVVPWMIGPKFDSAMSQTQWMKGKFEDVDIVFDEQEVVTHPNVLLWLKRTANQHLAASPKEIGVVVMPHGSTQPYNDVVESVVAPLKSKYRIEMAYGMADPFTIQQAVSRLESQGVRRIAFIRMYALADHMKSVSDYILGLSDAPPGSEHDHGGHGAAAPAQVRSAAMFSTFGGYEEDHRAIAEILHERIKAVSKDPAKETVILVAHGSDGDEQNAAWLSALNAHVDQLKKLTKPPFRAINVATVREDWPEKREQAVADLKDMIKQGNQHGRVLLISNRLYGSGPYKRLLDGSDYVLSDQGFAPHPNLTRWLENGIERTIAMLNDGRSVPVAETSRGSIAVHRE